VAVDGVAALIGAHRQDDGLAVLASQAGQDCRPRVLGSCFKKWVREML
jgi:hypothetical protein